MCYAVRPVRILLDYRPALRERTGVGEFVHELARALASTGADQIAILSTSFKDRVSAESAADLPGVRIVDRRFPVRGLTWTWNRLGWPPVEWLAGDADVVHSHTPLLIPARRSAQVVTIHDLDFLRHPERTDHIVVSSHYAASEVITRLGVARDRITVCSPGAPAWTSAIARGRAEREGTAASPAAGRILFVGTLEPRKNIATLLDAYARLRHMRPDAPALVLAGRAHASVASVLERLKKPPLAGHVTALGYVSDAERQKLYGEARLFVLPSLEEGFGLPVLEAMACGVPVVVSDRGSLPEVVGDAASPVNANDPNALAAEMSRLLDPAVARAAAARGTARAARYSWDECARSVRPAYRAARAVRERDDRRGVGS
jgi:glycosyltransferase involved in cell wall biosynthesis